MDNELFSWNTFIRRFGTKHENDEAEKRKKKNKAKTWGKRR